MYSASVSKELADQRVHRLNNPNGYSNDEKCYTIGMARADAKKKREQIKEEKAKAAKAKREAKKK